LTIRQYQSAFFDQFDDLVQFLDALQLFPGAMFMIKDLDSRYVYMSEPLRRAIHRGSESEVVGLTDFDLFPKIIAESFRQNDLLVLREGKTLLNEVHATCFFSHAPKWSFSSKFPLRDREGNIVGLLTLNEPYEEVMGKESDLGRLLPAIDYVSKNFGSPITVSDLAERCGVSASHFMRIFKTQLKMTPYAFVEQTRMYHAMELLKAGSLSIMQIAVDCGFYDHSAFAKRFKKFTGSTPLQFRKAQQDRASDQPVKVLPGRSETTLGLS
jgi:AraC-like DNA-binding protein